jgi:hypothetical protein
MNDVGQTTQEGTGQCPEWQDMTDSSPIDKSWWAQRHSLVVRSSVLEHHLESPDATLHDSPNSSTLEQGEGCPGRAPWRIFGKTSGCQETTVLGQVEVMIAIC